MKRLIYLVLMGWLLAACDVETSRNGDLDGFWQWQETDTLATGGKADMCESGIFWAVQFDLLEIRNTQSPMSSVLFRFRKTPETLTLYSPYRNDRNQGDVLVTDPASLHVYGLYSLEEKFSIEKLNSSQMVLRSANYRFVFRKY